MRMPKTCEWCGQNITTINHRRGQVGRQPQRIYVTLMGNFLWCCPTCVEYAKSWRDYTKRTYNLAQSKSEESRRELERKGRMYCSWCRFGTGRPCGTHVATTEVR